MGMKSLEQYRTDFIDKIKNTMATNLTNKGTSANGTETLQSLADKIANVNTGKRWATGTGYSDSSGFLTVIGLQFVPSVIKVKYLFGNAFLGFLVPANKGWYGGSGKYLMGSIYQIDAQSNVSSLTGLVNTEGNDVLSGIFKIKVVYINVFCEWEAWE